MGRFCEQPLKTGGTCKNPISDTSSRCAAGHSTALSTVADSAPGLAGCNLRETADGWICDAHRPTSEEWQVVLALGGKLPCRAPGTPAEWVRMARDRACGPATLTMLSRCTTMIVVAAVANNLNAPAHVLTTLARHEHARVRKAAATNPRTPGPALQLLFQEGTIDVLSNGNCPIQVLEQALGSTDLDKHNRLAWNPALPQHMLRQLAACADHTVRQSIAEHSRCDQKVLHRLAIDALAHVRSGVAWNKQTLPGLLEMLSHDEDETVRWAVAENPNTPLRSLIRLAEDWHDEVRARAARNPHLPMYIIQRLCDDTAHSVRLSAKLARAARY